MTPTQDEAEPCPVCGEPYASVFESEANVEYLHPNGKECKKPKYLPRLDVDTPAEYAALLAEETTLTEREGQVIGHLARDASYEQVADALDLSESAVEDHVDAATEKATRARQTVQLLMESGFEPAMPDEEEQAAEDQAAQEAPDPEEVVDQTMNPANLLYHTTDIVDGPDAEYPFASDDEDDEDADGEA